jgi:CheY-like chemotaxis protein
MGVVQPNLAVETHPSALRQVLIAAIRELAQHTTSGQITIGATRSERNARIEVSGQPAALSGTPDHAFIQEMVSTQGGTLRTILDGDAISLCVELPAVSRTVLVVDDNKDIAHLYRRYALGTSYHIVHTAQGKEVVELAERTQPDIIVLDVMLPDADGWELLSHLREHPATRNTPILICSVVREEELALALGADFTLTKPVERQQFVAALDRLLSQALA